MVINDEYNYINCDDYEYLEIACQNNDHLTITLQNDEVVEGAANRLFFKNKIEYIAIQMKNNQFYDVRLDKIVSFSHEKFGVIVVISD